MLRDDGSLELFKVHNVMIMKKTKHMIGHLMIGGRIGTKIMSNIVQTQIFSSLEVSISCTNLFNKHFWSVEISYEMLQIGSK